MNPINVGVIGATGMVDQNYIRLLNDHPWFLVTYVVGHPGLRERHTPKQWPADGL